MASTTGQSLIVVVRPLVCAVAACLFAGCGLTASQRAAIGTFSKSTTAAADVAAREIAETRADVIDFRQRMLILGSGGIDLNDPANDLDAAMDQDEAERRIAACAALKTYGELLSTMAASNRTEELAAASASFLTNLRKIKGVSISDEKAGAIGTLIVSIGNQVLEYRRKEVVRKVVQETQPAVQQVVKLLREDFDLNEVAWMRTLKANDDAIRSSLGRRMSTLKAGDDFDGRKLTDADLAAMHAAYDTLKSDSAKALADYTKLQPEILNSFDEMARAHDALFYIVQHDEVITRGEIETYLTQVSKLVDAVNVIRAKKHK